MQTPRDHQSHSGPYRPWPSSIAYEKKKRNIETTLETRQECLKGVDAKKKKNVDAKNGSHCTLRHPHPTIYGLTNFRKNYILRGEEK